MNNQQAIDRLIKHLEWGWTEYNGCIMFGCDHPKYAKMVKKRNSKIHERKEEG